ncbi:hypothetical protein KC238_13390 [Mycobacteroides chelonae]|uniref:hypothetical protein n=1 Tax=Mycobacteroides chelonae TaxID=1774 RepID=UPI001C2C4CFF|nr:hypothetical protein [Mycobacteroides chelonae]MBV0918245.1 hypothetical protein [Mycobacteroides chelonae]UJW66065.1 hypothetical protein H0I67_01060 [Mycobacteroides chelonae]
MDELIGRIDSVLDGDDDESLDDWQYSWSDAMRWAPEGAELPGDQSEGELDCGWNCHLDAQIHAIPVEQVAEWVACLETLPLAERGEIAWYVVCFRCGGVGERSVDCECISPR